MRLLCAPLQGYTDRCFRLAHSITIEALDDDTAPTPAAYRRLDELLRAFVDPQAKPNP